MTDSYSDGLELLCQKYALFLSKHAGKPSMGRANAAYNNIFASDVMDGSELSAEVNLSWLAERSRDNVGQKWVEEATRRSDLEASVLETLSSVWNARLEATVSGTRLVGVAVWRYVRTPESTLDYTVWDVTDEPGFSLPKLEFHVPGGDKPDSKGNRYVWLVTVMPECLLDCVQFPVGGMGKGYPLSFKYADVMANPEVFDSHWMRGEGTDSWEALSVLLKLKKQIPDMTGHPVVNLRVEAMAETWGEILDRRG